MYSVHNLHTLCWIPVCTALENRFTELRPSEITLMNSVDQAQGLKLIIHRHTDTHTYRLFIIRNRSASRLCDLKNSVNSGHLVPWHHTQAARTKIRLTQPSWTWAGAELGNTLRWTDLNICWICRLAQLILSLAQLSPSLFLYFCIKSILGLMKNKLGLSCAKLRSSYGYLC
jgi:hypothetical protein